MSCFLVQEFSGDEFLLEPNDGSLILEACTNAMTNLTDLADLLLATAGACLAETTAGAPTLQYISPAFPAYDCCPSLIVSVAALSDESTSPLSPIAATGHRTLYGRVTLATLVITVLRCAAPVQQDGSVLTADIEASAIEVQEDGWALWNCIDCAIRNEVFLDLCSIVHFDRAVAIREQGSCVGWEMILRCEINQIPCGEPTT